MRARAIGPSSIDVSGDSWHLGGRKSEDENSVRGRDQVSQNPDSGIPIGLGGVDGLAAYDADGNRDVGASDGHPEE